MSLQIPILCWFNSIRTTTTNNQSKEYLKMHTSSQVAIFNSACFSNDNFFVCCMDMLKLSVKCLFCRFVQQATDVKSTKLRTESKGSEQDTCAESTVANTTDINYDVDLQVDDLLTFKQNNRNTETNRHTPKQKQRHSQGQQASNVFGAENDTDHNTETEARSETDEPWNNEKSASDRATGSKSVVCDQCGNRYKDVSKHTR